MAWDDREIPHEIPWTGTVTIAGVAITPAEIERLKRIEKAALWYIRLPRPGPFAALQRAVMGWPTKPTES